jgi:hypothetical protein
MSYRLTENGRQYVVIAAGGHGRLGTDIGDYVVAFALPDTRTENLGQATTQTLRAVGVVLAVLLGSLIVTDVRIPTSAVRDGSGEPRVVTLRRLVFDRSATSVAQTAAGNEPPLVGAGAPPKP